MDENKNITINGVEFTPEMMAELKRWGEIRFDNENDPACFIETLSEIQDFLCSRFSEFGASDIEEYRENGDFISGIIHIKAALKPFANLRT